MTDLIRILFLLCLLPAVASASSATNGPWLLLGEDARTIIRLNLAEATGPPESRSCQIRRDFKARDERAYAVDTIEIDCPRKRYRYKSIAVFDHDDLLMHRYILNDQFCQIPEDSFLHMTWERACSLP